MGQVPFVTNHRRPALCELMKPSAEAPPTERIELESGRPARFATFW
jgi:hypothetical protein